MTLPSDALLTKLEQSPRARGEIAEHIQRQAVRRLELVAWFAATAQLIVWLLVNLIQGTLADEFESVLEWGFPATVLASSLGIAVLARSGRLAPAAVIRLGLVYEVLLSFAMAGGTYFEAFAGMAAQELTFDRVGLTFVGPWILLFSVLVPAPPREAALAILASAAAPPLVYLAQVPSGLAPALPAGKFVLVFVVPYLVVAWMTWVAVRIVYRLGVEVRRAQELGSYRLEALLGRGGMGEVWRASHRMLARPAAIKLIRPETLGETPGVAGARFEREAQVIASLQSPNTVALYDFGSTQNGTLYYVMELLDGVDLEDLVRQHGALPAERVCYILRQVCASLAEAHARGIVHRDIKPANIYLCRRALEHDVVKVLDFGLAKRLSAGAARVQGRVTQPELIAGTPSYLAPEAALDGVVDSRGDLYALGCVAFWLLTGRLVFEAESVAALLVAHARDAPRPPSSLAPFPVPEELDRAVLECLAKDPNARPQTADALAERLAVVPLAQPWTPAAAAEWWAKNRPADHRP